MALLERLRELGSQLKILQVTGGPPAVPDPGSPLPVGAPAAKAKPGGGRIPMRTLKLSDLETEFRAEELRALAEGPVELSIAFAQVFEAAGIKPGAHRWTIERLATTLRAEPFSKLDRPAAQRALLELLAKEKVPVEDLVKDAVSRDGALDRYQSFAEQKMKERAAARARKASELQAKIRELEAECEKLAATAQDEEERSREWHRRKVAQEKELAWAVGYLLDRPVISIDEPPRK